MTAKSCNEIIGLYNCISVYFSQFLLVVCCQQFIIGNRLKLSRIERTLGCNDYPYSFNFFLVDIFRDGITSLAERFCVPSHVIWCLSSSC